MAQEYTISNAYPATVKATGEHRTFEAHGNTLYVWRLFFEGLEGYYMTNRKEDNAPQKGDVVYGTLGEDKFGNGTFKSEQRPLGQLPTRNTNSTSVSGDVDAKLDYLISMVESMADMKSQTERDVVLEDISEDPIDLSEIPF